jgi:phospho-N-acetylmuramoyl-pentapeptide-transferase
MGGVLFSTFAALSCFAFGYTIDGLAIVLFSLIGFLDDLLSVVRKKSLGLRAWQKLSLQIVFAAVLVILIKPDTKLQIPFVQKDLELGNVYWIFAVLLIAGLSNATNLTDGLDGLATSVFLTSAIPYWLLLGKSADSLILLSLCLMAFFVLQHQTCESVHGRHWFTRTRSIDRRRFDKNLHGDRRTALLDCLHR